MKILFPIYLLLITLCTPVWAGPGVNNGGGGWKCFSAEGKTSWIYLQDFVDWWNVAYLESGDNIEKMRRYEGMSAEQIFKSKMKALRAIPEVAPYLGRYPANINSAIRFVDGPLDPIYDAGYLRRPFARLCPGGFISYLQIANYMSIDVLLIDRKIWQDPAFSELDKAALLTHEVLYKILRDKFGEESSSRVQAMVNDLFLIDNPEELRREIRHALTIWKPDPRNDKPLVPLFPFKLACEAFLRNRYKDGEKKQTRAILDIPPMKTFVAHIGDYTMQVRGDYEYSRPEWMEIDNEKTGARTSLSNDMAKAAFVMNKEVELILGEASDASEEAVLHCWANGPSAQ